MSTMRMALPLAGVFRLECLEGHGNHCRRLGRQSGFKVAYLRTAGIPDFGPEVPPGGYSGDRRAKRPLGTASPTSSPGHPKSRDISRNPASVAEGAVVVMALLLNALARASAVKFFTLPASIRPTARLNASTGSVSLRMVSSSSSWLRLQGHAVVVDEGVSELYPSRRRDKVRGCWPWRVHWRKIPTHLTPDDYFTAHLLSPASLCVNCGPASIFVLCLNTARAACAHHL